MATVLKLDLADEATVTQGELKVKFNAGGVTVIVNGKSVRVDRTGKIDSDATSETAPVKAELKIGERKPDGTVYAGISPDGGERLFVPTSDAPRMMTFSKAKDYARNLDTHGHKDWRLPTVRELKMLFNARSEIGGFTTRLLFKGSPGLPHRYWSVTTYPNAPNYVQDIDFRDGVVDWTCVDKGKLSSRVVRAEP